MGVAKTVVIGFVCVLVIPTTLSMQNRPKATLQIQGKITDSGNGSAIEGTVVSIEGKSGSATRSLQNGSYTIENLAAGAYTVRADDPRFWSDRHENVLAGEKDDFSLMARTYIIDLKGRYPYANVSVEVARRLLPIARTSGDVQAEYLLLNRLLQESPSDQELKTEATNAANELDKQKTVIFGVISDPQGAVVPGAEIMITSDIGYQVSTFASADGHFQASVFPLGEYKIEVTKAGFIGQVVTTSPVFPLNAVQENFLLPLGPN